MTLVTTPAATGTPSTDGLAYDFLALIKELQALFPTTAGAALASKIAVLGASKNLDTLDLALLKIGGVDKTAALAAAIATPVAGVAAGYKVARGVHVQAAASDTVVTGLATVVAVVASFSSNPTVKQNGVAATIGDQNGAPAAGSILIKTFKPTNNTNDSTPVAATDFTDNLGIAWIAIGT